LYCFNDFVSGDCITGEEDGEIKRKLVSGLDAMHQAHYSLAKKTEGFDSIIFIRAGIKKGENSGNIWYNMF